MVKVDPAIPYVDFPKPDYKTLPKLRECNVHKCKIDYRSIDDGVIERIDTIVPITPMQ